MPGLDRHDKTDTIRTQINFFNMQQNTNLKASFDEVCAGAWWQLVSSVLRRTEEIVHKYVAQSWWSIRWQAPSLPLASCVSLALSHITCLCLGIFSFSYLPFTILLCCYFCVISPPTPFSSSADSPVTVTVTVTLLCHLFVFVCPSILSVSLCLSLCLSVWSKFRER